PIESFLTMNFNHLFFDNNNKVNYDPSQELPTYSIEDIKSVDAYLEINYATEYKKVNREFPHYKTLRGLISSQVQKLFEVVERHERRYWVGTWRLLEFLHVTQCPAMILVKSGLTANYFMSTINGEYDKFLQSLLKDKQVVHQPPKFDASVIQKIIDL
ncbi:12587_t:CDS:2, partial [Dentiscutata heterogama]